MASAEELRALGASVQPAWLAACLGHLQGSVPGFAARPQQEKLQLVLGQLLLSDFNHCGGACLPPNVQGLHDTTVQGRFVVQLEEAVNIGAPARERYSGRQGPGRMLKLLLSDGVQQVVGLEYRPIPDLASACPAGAKLTLRDPPVRRGMLLLSPQCCSVLGGRVGRLDVARQKAEAEWNQPAVGRRGPPPTLTELEGRASHAAWAPGGAPQAEAAAVPPLPPQQQQQQQQHQQPQQHQQQQQQQHQQLQPQQHQPPLRHSQQPTQLLTHPPQQQQQGQQQQPGQHQVAVGPVPAMTALRRSPAVQPQQQQVQHMQQQPHPQAQHMQPQQVLRPPQAQLPPQPPAPGFVAASHLQQQQQPGAGSGRTAGELHRLPAQNVMPLQPRAGRLSGGGFAAPSGPLKELSANNATGASPPPKRSRLQLRKSGGRTPLSGGAAPDAALPTAAPSPARPLPPPQQAQQQHAGLSRQGAGGQATSPLWAAAGTSEDPICLDNSDTEQEQLPPGGGAPPEGPAAMDADGAAPLGVHGQQGQEQRDPGDGGQQWAGGGEEGEEWDDGWEEEEGEQAGHALDPWEQGYDEQEQVPPTEGQEEAGAEAGGGWEHGAAHGEEEEDEGGGAAAAGMGGEYGAAGTARVEESEGGFEEEEEEEEQRGMGEQPAAHDAASGSLQQQGEGGGQGVSGAARAAAVELPPEPKRTQSSSASPLDVATLSQPSSPSASLTPSQHPVQQQLGEDEQDLFRVQPLDPALLAPPPCLAEVRAGPAPARAAPPPAAAAAAAAAVSLAAPAAACSGGSCWPGGKGSGPESSGTRVGGRALPPAAAARAGGARQQVPTLMHRLQQQLAVAQTPPAAALTPARAAAGGMGWEGQQAATVEEEEDDDDDGFPTFEVLGDLSPGPSAARGSSGMAEPFTYLALLSKQAQAAGPAAFPLEARIWGVVQTFVGKMQFKCPESGRPEYRLDMVVEDGSMAVRARLSDAFARDFFGCPPEQFEAQLSGGAEQRRAAAELAKGLQRELATYSGLLQVRLPACGSPLELEDLLGGLTQQQAAVLQCRAMA